MMVGGHIRINTPSRWTFAPRRRAFVDTKLKRIRCILVSFLISKTQTGWPVGTGGFIWERFNAMHASLVGVRMNEMKVKEHIFFVRGALLPDQV